MCLFSSSLAPVLGPALVIGPLQSGPVERTSGLNRKKLLRLTAPAQKPRPRASPLGLAGGRSYNDSAVHCYPSAALASEVSVVHRFGLLLIFLLLLAPSCPTAALASDDPQMLEVHGQTMGTSFMVKVFDPPADFPGDWRHQIDQELRRVNDQMSTYLKSSEISRFNASDSTQWFAVSPETAMVVAVSLEIHTLSGGAFDITVAPLVDLWSFGPATRTFTPPDSEVVRQRLARIGSDKLSARLDPPAIRKHEPELSIDLSAIAKGHGVDRVSDLLRTLGAAHTFVEIGGEVRATGDKAGTPWMVGLQQPDVAGQVVAVAHALKDEAVATSGDYRNFFEHAGQRYSHTLDPRTGRPVKHSLASVSVFAPDCMRADAWATAIHVLGPEEGLRLAQSLGLDTLLMIRGDSGEIVSVGAGRLAAAGIDESPASTTGSFSVQNWLLISLIGLVVFAVVLGGMAIGVMFGRRSIRGSCGGLANQKDADGQTSCSLCSNPENACRELQENMQTK
jgi:FAD:protein FMN transferase